MYEHVNSIIAYIGRCIDLYNSYQIIISMNLFNWFLLYLVGCTSRIGWKCLILTFWHLFHDANTPNNYCIATLSSHDDDILIEKEENEETKCLKNTQHRRDISTKCTGIRHFINKALHVLYKSIVSMPKSKDF